MTTISPRVRVYVACSLDGFIAGKGDDLSWLSDISTTMGATDDAVIEFPRFLSSVGALLMGRRTFDVVTSLPDELPYGEIPLLVATRRPLESSFPNVRPVHGTISEMIDEARKAAGGRDVYVDGGDLICQALDAGEVDDLIITVAPRVLGEGTPLFSGVRKRHRLEFTGHYRYGAMLQVHARPID